MAELSGNYCSSLAIQGLGSQTFTSDNWRGVARDLRVALACICGASVMVAGEAVLLEHGAALVELAATCNGDIDITFMRCNEIGSTSRTAGKGIRQGLTLQLSHRHPAWGVPATLGAVNHVDGLMTSGLA